MSLDITGPVWGWVGGRVDPPREGVLVGGAGFLYSKEMFGAVWHKVV